MKSAYVLPIAFICLLAGGALGYFIGSRSASPVTPDPSGKQGDSPEARSMAAPPQPGERNSLDRFAPDSTSPAGVHAAEEDLLAQWLMNLGDVPKRQGTGIIRGRVMTTTNQPLAGVTIKAVEELQNLPAPIGEKLPEYVERMARQRRALEAATVAATTDADGRYELRGLDNVEHNVTAQFAGYFLHRVIARDRYRRFLPGAVVDFIAQQGCELVLDVRLPDGSRPESATASVHRGENSNQSSKWTPASPSLWFASGTGLLTVTAGKDREYLSDPQHIEMRLGEALRLEVELQLQPAILAHVNLKGDYRPEEVFAYVIADPPAEPPETPAEHVRGGADMTYADAARFPLNPGRYRVVAATPQRILAWRDVTLGRELLKVILDVPDPDPAEFIETRVYGPDGELRRNVEFVVGLYAGETYLEKGSRPAQRPDGSYWIERAAPRNVRGEWRYQVRATAEGLGSITASYPSSGTHVLEIRFPKPATLTVHVTGASQSRLFPRLGANLWKLGDDGKATGAPINGRLAGDAASFGPIEQGSYLFSLTLKKMVNGTWSISSVRDWDVELTAGENTLTCPMPGIYTLTLLIPRPEETKWLDLSCLDGPLRGSINISSRQIGERTEIEGIIEGMWRIASTTGEMTVHVTRDMEVQLEIRPFDCLRIRTMKPGGKFEALGLRDGDIVIAADGRTVEDLQPPDPSALLALSLEKESTTWTILRGGISEEVTFSGKVLKQILYGSTTEREAVMISPAVRK